jgi:hypothetical protein
MGFLEKTGNNQKLTSAMIKAVDGMKKDVGFSLDQAELRLNAKAQFGSPPTLKK